MLLSLVYELPNVVEPGAPPSGLIDLVDALRPKPSDIARMLLSREQELETAPTGDEPGRLVRAIDNTTAAVVRVKLLVLLLEARPVVAAKLRDHMAAVFAARRARHLLSETGIPEHEGLIAGVFRRIGAKLLPRRRDRVYWDDLFGEVFSASGDADWVAAVPLDIWARLYRVVAARPPAETEPLLGFRQLQAEAAAAAAMLSHRLASLGVEPVLRRYYAPSAQQESPFLAQAHELTAWAGEAAASDDPSAVAPDRIQHGLVLLDQCEEVLKRVRKLSNTQGTSVPLTNATRRGVALVTRLRELLTLLRGGPVEERSQAFASLFVDLVDGECSRQSVRRFIGESTDLVALQMTEHAARTGEHYVTSTRAEYWAMARSAAGAGLVVGFMALAKLLIGHWHLPPFWDAVLCGLNYSVGFVLIHLLHYTVATKQPAMTAAKFASTLDQSVSGRQPDQVADLTAQVTRTQLVAILGNVLVALPVSFLIALVWRYSFGAPVIDEAKASSVLGSLHPWLSWALPHAAIAGVCLFLSGLVSGYFDNLCVYLRLPELMLESPRLTRWFGTDRTRRLSDYVANNLGAIAGNSAFGFLLSFVGFFGIILGLPLDIRHVTFSAAYLAQCTVALDFDVGLGQLAIASLGVALVAAVNLAVSFSLAITVAMRARGVRLPTGLRFMTALRRKLWTSPRAFFLPPRGP